MLARPLMLGEKLPFVDKNHPQGNNFVMGVKVKATGDSKLYESLVVCFKLFITL